MKNIIKLKSVLSIACCFCLCSSSSFAQNKTSQWDIISRDNTNGKEYDVFADHKYFQLEENNDIIKYKTYTDEVGKRHEKYVQVYKGYLVEEGHYILHYNGNTLSSMNGNIVNDLAVDDSKIISETEAIQNAVKALEAKEIKTEEYKITKPRQIVDLEKNRDLEGVMVITSNNDGKTYFALL